MATSGSILPAGVQISPAVPQTVVLERPVIVERPVLIEIERTIIVEKAVLVDRPVIVEKPVFIDREKILYVERPVIEVVRIDAILNCLYDWINQCAPSRANPSICAPACQSGCCPPHHSIPSGLR